MVDLLEYSTRHFEAIDWEHLRRNWPRVVNTITLLHYLVPLPAALAALRPPSGTLAPAGIGLGFPPLGTVRRSPREWPAQWRRLVYPSPVVDACLLRCASRAFAERHPMVPARSPCRLLGVAPRGAAVNRPAPFFALN